MTNLLFNDAVLLLKQLIATPSVSKNESGTAAIIRTFLEQRGIPFTSIQHNIIAQNKYFDAVKPTILLNSHHDTVKPNAGYTLHPYEPIENNGKLYGLGSNDAGGCLVSLLACFFHFYHQQALPFNLIFVASAEEEISGVNGIEAVLPHLPRIDMGIVGEPTQMQMAVAERGLMVIDAVATGTAAHAALKEGDNALYKAINDIQWLQQYTFDRVSTLLGATFATVTVINTENTQHNIVPAHCHFVMDVRVNELYTFDEILQLLRSNLQSTLTPRSTRLKSTSIALEHPLVQAGLAMGKTYYGSPTTSDKALMPFPTLKMGPGDSARSHTADEFIYLDDIQQGIAVYIHLLNNIVL